MTNHELVLLSDSRLSREARIMGLYVASMGGGEHEVPHDKFRALLGRGPQGLPHDRTIAGYVKELVTYGWLTRKPGGRGSPRYSFDPTPGGGQTTPSGSTRGGVQNYDGIRDASRVGLSPHPRGGQSAPIVVEGDVDVDDDEVARERAKLSDEVVELVNDELLAGCRGSLHDYLTHRVPTGQHLGYVQTIRGWLNGLEPYVFKKNDGSSVDPGERTPLIAAALNDLLGSNESLMKRPVGDIANLKTKLSILRNKGVWNAGRNGRDRGEPSSATRGEAPSDIARGQGGWVYENDHDDGRPAA